MGYYSEKIKDLEKKSESLSKELSYVNSELEKLKNLDPEDFDKAEYEGKYFLIMSNLHESYIYIDKITYVDANGIINYDGINIDITKYLKGNVFHLKKSFSFAIESYKLKGNSIEEVDFMREYDFALRQFNSTLN